MTEALPILDCHQHFYDSHLMRYGVFTEPSAGFAAVVGDYAALPRVYRPEDYARDVADLNVVGSVWAEFISSDPLKEVEWASALNRDGGLPSGLIALVDFADPALDHLLDTYQAIGPVRSVRQHMSWPIDLTKEGHAAWKRDLTTVGACPNVTLKIFGMECIFGVGWTTAQVRPWILDAIEIFGPNRCMFAGHMPICKLACSFAQLYAAYGEIIVGFTLTEKRHLLHDTAAKLCGILR
jgi:predicted TIM-barrel fold metal-dependent hydrolase